MTIQELRDRIEACGADLTRPGKQRSVGTVPLADGHKIEIFAPVPVFFDKEEAKESGQPCYVVGKLGGVSDADALPGDKWGMIYTARDADIGFTGTEEEISARLIEYLRRNWKGIDEKVDALIAGL